MFFSSSFWCPFSLHATSTVLFPYLLPSRCHHLVKKSWIVRWFLLCDRSCCCLLRRMNWYELVLLLIVALLVCCLTCSFLLLIVVLLVLFHPVSQLCCHVGCSLLQFPDNFAWDDFCYPVVAWLNLLLILSSRGWLWKLSSSSPAQYPGHPWTPTYGHHWHICCRSRRRRSFPVDDNLGW